MSSPIDNIGEGILEGNWEIVCEGFERLTGQRLPIPGQTDDSEAIQKIHNITSSALGLDLIAEICDEEAEVETTTSTKRRGKGKKAKKAKKASKKKKSTISKEGEDSSIVLQDRKRTPGPSKDAGTAQHITNTADPDEVARNKEKAARTNRANFEQRPVDSKKFKVECNECLNDFQSDRRTGKMGQKCPKCLNGRKSQFNG